MTFLVLLFSPSVYERKGNNLKYNHQIFFQIFTNLILHLTTSLSSAPFFTILTRYSSSLPSSSFFLCGNLFHIEAKLVTSMALSHIGNVETFHPMAAIPIQIEQIERDTNPN